MQTYTFEKNQTELSSIIQNQTTEPLILKNAAGMNYLVIPYSPEKWQEVLLMIYRSVDELSNANVVQEQTVKPKKMTAKEFSDKWAGVLNEADVINWKDNYYNDLMEKHQ